MYLEYLEYKCTAKLECSDAVLSFTFDSLYCLVIGFTRRTDVSGFIFYLDVVLFLNTLYISNLLCSFMHGREAILLSHFR